jgi:diacylglycerol kinase (ATP)
MSREIQRHVRPAWPGAGLIVETAHAIVNPASGSGRPVRAWPPLKRRLEALGLRVEEERTGGPGEATLIARRLLQRGARELIVVGGDGTLNEVVNGYLDDDGRPIARDAVLTIVPCGTGRDFPRLFGITRPEQVVSLLRDGEVCRVDIGVVEYCSPSGRPERRYFVNMADVGLGAETAAWVSQSTKMFGGFLAYMVGATRTILRYRSRPLELWVDDELVHRGPALMVALANGRFHAGGMRIAPMASVTDGLLEVFILRQVSRWQLLTSLLPAVYRGGHIGHPAVRHWQAHRVAIHAPEPLRIEMDGEQPGTTDVTASVLRRAVAIRVPRGTCEGAGGG